MTELFLIALQLVISGGNMSLGGNVRALPAVAEELQQQATDCATHAPSEWDSQGFDTDAPFSETDPQNGDLCNLAEPVLASGDGTLTRVTIE